MSKKIEWKKSEIDYSKLDELTPLKLAAINGAIAAHSNPETKKRIIEGLKKAAIAGGKANKGVKKKLDNKYKQTALNRPDSHNQKISESLKGTTFKTERKLKISESIKQNPKIQCPHCLNLSDPRNYSRWHGDNCKKKGA